MLPNPGAGDLSGERVYPREASRNKDVDPRRGFYDVWRTWPGPSGHRRLRELEQATALGFNSRAAPARLILPNTFPEPVQTFPGLAG